MALFYKKKKNKELLTIYILFTKFWFSYSFPCLGFPLRPNPFNEASDHSAQMTILLGNQPVQLDVSKRIKQAQHTSGHTSIIMSPCDGILGILLFPAVLARTTSYTNPIFYPREQQARPSLPSKRQAVHPSCGEMLFQKQRHIVEAEMKDAIATDEHVRMA